MLLCGEDYIGHLLPHPLPFKGFLDDEGFVGHDFATLPVPPKADRPQNCGMEIFGGLPAAYEDAAAPQRSGSMSVGGGGGEQGTIGICYKKRDDGSCLICNG